MKFFIIVVIILQVLQVCMANIKILEESLSGEKNSIKTSDVPFIKQLSTNYVTMSAQGEPKSGTSWLGRVIPQIAVDLCGSYTNTWCEMGGIVMHPNIPAPWYEFEMLNVEHEPPSLFLYFQQGTKHVIEGMREFVPEECRKGNNFHIDYFADLSPCSTPKQTREELMECIWDTSDSCIRMENEHNNVKKKTVVIFRDPRDIILSERKMRINVYNQRVVKNMSAEHFIIERFNNLVAWIHQRWVWHTQTLMKEYSHVVYHEDLQTRNGYEGVIGIAEFMGLNCSSEQGQNIWEKHKSSGTARGFNDWRINEDTIGWMNNTMARLLPEELVVRYGLVPII